MEDVFNKIGTKIYTTNNHIGYSIKWNLIAPLCKKWSRNRDPDSTRVDEMINFYNNGGYIPPVLHLAEIQEEGLVCYDGNHRRELFNQLENTIDCIVDIMFNTTQSEVFKSFDNINKSVQLPAIYLDEHKDSTKEDILQLVKTYEQKYKNFLSTSSRCRAPNFNRDNFVDNIYNILNSFHNMINVKELSILLTELNYQYSIGNLCRPHYKYSPAVIKKCTDQQLWLFLERDICIEHVHKIYSQW